MNDKMQIISSASTYLNGKIKGATADGKALNMDELKSEVWRETGTSLLMPTSEFDDASEMFKTMKEGHYLLPDEQVGEVHVLALCDTWVEATRRAKEEGRYFGREKNFLRDKYGNDNEAALKDMEGFLANHGYHLKEGENTSQALGFMDLNELYQHESERVNELPIS